MKIISTKINTIFKYGRLKIKTRVGELEYSFKIGGDTNDYQLESTLSQYHELTNEELDKIDDLIMDELNKLK